MLPTSLLLFISLCTFSPSAATARKGAITVPVAKKVNVTTARHIIKNDRARVARLKEIAKAKSGGQLSPKPASLPGNIEVTNQAVTYTASIDVGNPPTTFSLLVDTGSSNTWVGAGKPFVQTNTSQFTGDLVEVIYGSGAFLGNEFIDTVSLGPGLTITGQSIGTAVESVGFDGVDGIIGIGPVDLTEGTLFPDSDALIPTVTDNLFSQGTIPSNVVSISFEPTTSLSDTNGELTFGGTDPSKFIGEISFVPVTTTLPAGEFWGVNQSVSYAGQPILQETSGIVDTGTTLTLLATDAFDAYQNATGGVLDNNTGLLQITQDQFDNLSSLLFNVGGTTFELTPNAQLWPRVLNTAIGGEEDALYLIVNDLGSPSGEGFDFVNGMTFLERHYSVFDTANQQVGLATTPFTNATTN